MSQSSLWSRLLTYTPPQPEGFAIAPPPEPPLPKGSEAVTASLEDNLRALFARFHAPQNKDFILRRFTLGETSCALTYLEGMVERIAVGNLTLGSLFAAREMEGLQPEELVDAAVERVIRIGEVKIKTTVEDVQKAILSGQAALFFSGAERAVVVDVRGYEKRSITTPQTEEVVDGSQEGFTEDMRMTITQIRRLVRTGELVTEYKTIGTRAPLDCAILYLADVANPSIVDEVRRRLDRIDYDFLPGVGFIQQFIDDEPDSWIPQSVQTERPDRTASFLMEGQVVLVCDGTPRILAAPATIWHLLHTSDVTYMRWPLGAFEQGLRMLGILISLCLPSIYIAFALHHPETIPAEMLSTITASHIKVPFSSMLELFLLLFAYDLILEAGTRVPGVLGSTISIVGALILGQAAVEANLISTVLITVVAMTGLGGFCVPDYQTGIGLRMYRYVLLLFSATWGLIGFCGAMLLGVGYLCSLSSFGAPFFAPLAPRVGSLQDTYFRTPLQRATRRPPFFYPIRKSRVRGGR